MALQDVTLSAIQIIVGSSTISMRETNTNSFATLHRVDTSGHDTDTEERDELMELRIEDISSERTRKPLSDLSIQSNSSCYNTTSAPTIPIESDDIFSSTSSPLPSNIARSKRKLRTSKGEDRLPDKTGTATKRPKLDAYTLLCAATRRSSRQQSLPKSTLEVKPADSVVGKTDAGEDITRMEGEKNGWINTVRSEGSITPQVQAQIGTGVINLCSPSPTKRPLNSAFSTPAPFSSDNKRVVNQWQLLTPPASSPLALRSTESDPRPHTRVLRHDLSPFADGDDGFFISRSFSSDVEDEDEDNDEEEGEEDAAGLAEARRRTMIRFGMGGRGRGLGVGGRDRRGGLSEMPTDTTTMSDRQEGLGGFEDMRKGLLTGIAGSRNRIGRLNTTSTYLSLFTSNSIHSEYRVSPNPTHPSAGVKDWSPAYACAYSNTAKMAGKSLLALASESGAVKIVDTNNNAAEENMTPSGGYYTPHTNAIFDIKWSADDSMLLSMSADQSSAVYDVGTLTHKATLKGHSSSIKTGTWYDPNVVVTAGRDGNILIYDLRTAGDRSSVVERFGSEIGNARVGRAKPEHAGGDNVIHPVLKIRSAHGDVGKRGPAFSRSATRSVTCVLALKGQPHVLASGGSSDGIIKLWDLRNGIASRGKSYISENMGQTIDRSAEKRKRSRGVIGMVEGGGNIYTLSGHSMIHAHSITNPDVSMPISYSHPNLRASTFYVKLAISPCERYLASGSSNGGVFTWNIGETTRNHIVVGQDGEPVQEDEVTGVEMAWNGHSREVGAVDWGYDQLASCSDDYTSRVWRPDHTATDLIRRDPKSASWNWSGVGNAKFTS